MKMEDEPTVLNAFMALRDNDINADEIKILLDYLERKEKLFRGFGFKKLKKQATVVMEKINK